MDNIVNFGEEKLKRELQEMNPEDLLGVLLDAEKCAEFIAPAKEEAMAIQDLTDGAYKDVCNRIMAHLDERYGDEKGEEAADEFVSLASTIAMKILGRALMMLPPEEYEEHLESVKSMTLFYTALMGNKIAAEIDEEEQRQ